MNWQDYITQEQDDETKTQFKTGLIVDNNESFLYYKLNRNDKYRLAHITGVYQDELQTTIMTTHEYPFTTGTTIQLDNVQYYIKSIYTEDFKNENNKFNFKALVKTYLVLSIDN